MLVYYMFSVLPITRPVMAILYATLLVAIKLEVNPIFDAWITYVQEDGGANCFDWLSFGGTQYKTTGFESLTQATPGFQCLDREDCCKFTPKAGPALLWVDSAPYDDFSSSSLSEYIPGRFSQHRMKYMANAYVIRGLRLFVCLPQKISHGSMLSQLQACTNLAPDVKSDVGATIWICSSMFAAVD